MSEQVVIGILLGLAFAVAAVSVVGLIAMRDVYQRIHYLTPISMIAPLLVAIAVTVKSGWSENTGQSWIALGFVILVSPFLSHATIRAARIRERGDWKVDDAVAMPKEKRPV